ncbi:MAG: HupE/UreJ family protein [Alphaproteobacteria bacterium]|nr:HupE/UreJ family protein [Alphaproteobacteria bacterium]
MARNFRTLVLAAAALAGFSGAAEAHPGHGAVGFAAGLLHPLSGLDHMVAMVAVGLFAARLGGRALWALPMAFIGMMSVGGALGMNGFALPYVEVGIAASVLVLGALVALEWSLPVSAAMGLVGFFALFHGHAHGSEMPALASGLSYGLGFVAATALLHGAGLALGVALKNSAGVVKVAGAAAAIAGAGLLLGAI